MQLRDHPTVLNENWWPPMWVRVDDPSKHPLEGDDEAGTLTQVRILDLKNSTLSMRMSHQNRDYVTHLQVRDTEFCLYIYTLLRACIGKSIKEIGDLEVSAAA